MGKKEEARAKKKEYDRKRREEMKRDPVKLQQMKEREKLKYMRKREKGVPAAKLASQMTNREKRIVRKEWKKRSKRYRENKKKNSEILQPILIDSSPSPTPTSNTSNNDLIEEGRNSKAIGIQEKKTVPTCEPQLLSKPSTSRELVGRKRVKRSRSKMYRTIKELEGKLSLSTKRAERYKKKYQRVLKKKEMINSNNIPELSTPRRRVNKFLGKEKVSSHIRKRLLFCEVLTAQMRENLTSLGDSHRKKRAFYKMMKNNILRKYRFMNSASKECLLKTKSSTNSLKLASLNVLPRGCYLNKKVREDIKFFFERDDVSRITAGKKECVTVKKEKRQKRFLNDNLKKLHEKFLTTVDYKVSYQSFCRLKPFWVKYPKANDRDTCGCIIHVNFELIIKKLHEMKVINDFSSSDMLKTLCCDRYNTGCLFRQCHLCKEKNLKINTFEDCEVKLRRWTTVPITCVVKGKEKTVRKVSKTEIVITVKNLVDLLNESLHKFMCHSGNIVHQFNAINKLKSGLGPNEAFIHVDFSENFSTKYAEEIQSFHFGGSRKQITLHTGVLYLKNSDGVIKSFPFCTLSKSLCHDAFAIWAHLKPIFKWATELKAERQEVLNVIHMLSDSPATQYRNKSMFHILSHHIDQIIPNLTRFSWNYSEAGHGKGAPDGIGGTLKRSADRAVAEGKDVGNFDEFVSVLKERCPGVHIVLVTEDNIHKFENEVSGFIPVPFKGTMKVHQVVYSKNMSCIFFNSLSCFECPFDQPCCHFHLGSGYDRLCKFLDEEATSSNVQQKHKRNKKEECGNSEIGSWVAVIYDNHWVPGVIEKERKNMVTIKFMKIIGQNRFVWPQRDDQDTIPLNSILTTLSEHPELVSYTGRAIHSLPMHEYQRVSDIFNSVN